MEHWRRLRFLPGTPLGADGRRVTACAEHIALSKTAAKEGMVLLKNEGDLLPFPKGTRLALFGKGIFDYVKGGGGSGDVTTPYTVDLYDGLKAMGDHVRIEEQTAEYYRDYVRAQYETGLRPGMIAEPELPDALCEKARAFADTALIAISRFSGEGWDRSAIEGENTSESYRILTEQNRQLFEHGDFYLSEAEAAMVEKVRSRFARIAVVLNVGGVVDTEWFREDDAIRSVLLAWQAGTEGGAAAAELLCGCGTPCGKLADTFAKRLEDYPSTAGFHESEEYVDYTEDIYVGYRYFETIPGAAETVNYPFGFGLSYTRFSRSIECAAERGGMIEIRALVTNVGKRAGKEVLQAYYSAPQGLLGKPERSLAAFQKTKLLQPGEQQRIVLCFPVREMASYDDLGRVRKSACILEKGVYRFYVGSSVRDAEQLAFAYRVAEDTVTEQLSEKLAPTQLSRRLRSDGSYEPLPVSGQRKEPAEEPLEPLPACSAYGLESPAVRAVGRIPRMRQYRKARIRFPEVADGTQALGAFLAQLSDDEQAHLLGGQPNTGVADCFGFGNLPEYELPSAMTADGPAGLRIRPDRGVCTTAFPCATLLACTWDPEITYRIGQAGAKEVKENNLAAWLAPAVNIHRSPLCGRNFEYYSEDPLLAGILAAGMVRGIQSQQIAPSVKHFALNNKETNRKNSDSRVSERAAREIYLKVFEIIVKTAHPWYVMSSYNLINGVRASENRELLEDILRGEWGFDGMVSTDWWTNGEHWREVKAGNDLKMATGYPERLLAAMEAGVLSRAEMERCAERVLRLMLRFE